MHFGEMEFRNFFSFAPEVQKLKLHRRGFTLVTGENRDDPTTANNGSAKSALFEAFLWCLFGKTVRGVEGDDVVNRKSGGDCMVTVPVIDDKGDKYLIERYRLDSKNKNKLILTGPKGSLTANESSVTQERINEVIGMSFDAFTNAVVFGQGLSKHFAGMTDKQQKEVTDKLVGIEVVSKAAKLARQESAQLDVEIQKLQSAMVDLDELKAKVKESKEEHDGWADVQRERIKTLKDKLGNVEKVDVAETEELLKTAQSVVSKREQARDAYASGVLNTCDAEVRKCDTDLADIREVLANMKTKGGECDHCGSVVDANHLKAFRDKWENKAVKADERKAEAVKKYREAKTELTRLSDKVDAARQDVKNATTLVTKAKELAEKRRQLKKQIEDVEAETNPHVKALARAKKELEEGEEANKQSYVKTLSWQAKKRHVDFCYTMLSDKGGPGMPPLKSLILESVTPFINRKLAQYAKALTDGNITVRFDTQSELKSGEMRELYSLKSVNRFGSATYEGNSGGEKRKVDAVTFLAFAALANSRSNRQVSLSVYDEIFDALDEVAQEVMVELLLEEKKKRDSVFVITQRPELEAYFPSVVKVVKKGGYSRLVT